MEQESCHSEGLLYLGPRHTAGYRIRSHNEVLAGRRILVHASQPEVVHAPCPALRMTEVGVKDGHIGVIFQGHVAIIKMCRGENRINNEFLDEMNAALDHVLGNDVIKAVITTGQSRFYSNGVDIDVIARYSQDKSDAFKRRYSRLLARIMTLPLVTVAAINGHAFAGGALLAAAHDHVVMQTTRGWWCMNEVHIQVRFTAGLVSFLRNKLPTGPVLHEVLVLGRRFSAEQALGAGIVQETCPPDRLLSCALSWIRNNVLTANYDRSHLQRTKEDVYRDVVDLLRGPTSHL